MSLTRQGILNVKKKMSDDDMILVQRIYQQGKCMKIAITGHRPNKLNNEYDLEGPMTDFLRHKLQSLIKHYEPTHMISGMALGVDMLLATMAIENDIPLIAAIPFLGQECLWSEKSQKMYRNILSYQKCEKVIVCEGKYEAWKMNRRNEWMVDNCDLLIKVWDGTLGGTANCCRYADKEGKKSVLVNPNDFYTSR